jgi:FdhD protein
MTGSNLAVDINRIRGDQRSRQQDYVAVEEPLEIQLSSPTAKDCAARSISITMRTPGDDIELALGFLYSEAIISGMEDVAAAASVGNEDNNTVRITLNPDVEVDLQRLERHFYTTSSCGVCGKASLDALHVTGQQPFTSLTPQFSSKMIVGMPERLRAQQALFSDSGGLHAAAVFNTDGKIIESREDVGRHNAVDKDIGALLRGGQLPGRQFGILVSGRASFELLQKTLVARIPLLAAIGAPSSMAVQLASEFGMTLIGFLRDNNYNVYSAVQRVTEE